MEIALERLAGSRILARPVGLFILIIFCMAVGVLSSLISGSGPSPWYDALLKSPLNPPSWTFGVVWPCLYAFMGLSVWLIMRTPETPDRRLALILFWLQLAINFTWSWVFFDQHWLGWSVAHIGILWIVLALTIWRFSRIRPLAAWLLLPYLAWITFAGHLSYAIWDLND